MASLDTLAIKIVQSPPRNQINRLLYLPRDLASPHFRYPLLQPQRLRRIRCDRYESLRRTRFREAAVRETTAATDGMGWRAKSRNWSSSHQAGLRRV